MPNSPALYASSGEYGPCAFVAEESLNALARIHRTLYRVSAFSLVNVTHGASFERQPMLISNWCQIRCTGVMFPRWSSWSQ